MIGLDEVLAGEGNDLSLSRWCMAVGDMFRAELIDYLLWYVTMNPMIADR